jgi:Ca2+-binding EF-hand superfamily protein
MGLKNDGDTSRGNRVRDWITAKQLRSLARDLGVKISLKKAKWLERKFDKEGDGRMKFDEFKEVI